MSNDVYVQNASEGQCAKLFEKRYKMTKMSKAPMPKGSGKMSAAHGTNSGNPTKGMVGNTANRVGANCGRFSNTLTKRPGK